MIQAAEKDAAMLALVNQFARPNSEQNGNSVQLHKPDAPHPSFHADNERQTFGWLLHGDGERTESG